MTDVASSLPMLMVFLGLVTLLSAPLRAFLGRLSLPGMVGFILLGVALSVLDAETGVLTPRLQEEIVILAQFGIVALLFRVGLESDLDQLARQLRRAAMIWVPDMLVPAMLVFMLILAWPGLGLIPALVAGIAASATSVGVGVAAWEDAGRLDTEDGALLLDVAELDDLSAVVVLGVVVAVLPALHDGTQGDLVGEVAWAGGLQLARIIGFCLACYAFSRLAERRLTAAFSRLDRRIGPFVFATGTVFVIAALAEALGLSFAIGALFAGLAFSRDPAERQIDLAFAYFLAVFGPFFFVSIGLSVRLDDIQAAAALALALFAALVAGKLLGAGVATWILTDSATGLLIGASMIPRAEIYLILMLHGLALGEWAVPPMLYSAAVLASIGTCILGPLMVGRLIGQEHRRDGVA